MTFQPMRLIGILAPMVAMMLMLAMPDASWALGGGGGAGGGGGGAPPAPSQVCTNFENTSTTAFDPAAPPGLLTNITNYVKQIINSVAESLYKSFITNTKYTSVVYPAATLMIIFYGVGFLIGVVQASFAQVLVRMVKLGIIFTLISPTGWGFFSNYVVKFFNEGTDQLIGGVMAIGTGIPFNPGDSPFKQLDQLAGFVLQPDSIVKIMGSIFAGGPYGLMMGGFLAFGVMGLLQLILQALKLYAVSFVVRSLLLGIAPVFIVFLMFDRTKPLFTGWLNALVDLSIKPILYFTFISFFMVMLVSASKDMLGGDLCWSEFQNVGGSTNKMAFWRFKDKTTGGPMVDTMSWKGSLECQLSGSTTCEPFPVNIIDMLSFLILIYIASQFSKIVDRLSSEISSVFVNLNMDAKMGLMPGGGGGGGVMPPANRPKGR